MDGLSKLSREAQVVLAGGVVLLVLSFFDWQQVPFSLGFGVGQPGLNEWHGIGVVAGVLVIAMLVWDVLRLLAVDVQLGTLSPGLVSVGLALLMALFTLIAFFNKSLFRHWPAWIALIVALGVAVVAVARARAEGVQLPQASSPAPAAPAEPVAPAPAEPGGAADSTDGPSE